MGGPVEKRPITCPFGEVIADSDSRGEARRHLVLVLTVPSLNRPAVFCYEGISPERTSGNSKEKGSECIAGSCSAGPPRILKIRGLKCAKAFPSSVDRTDKILYRIAVSSLDRMAIQNFREISAKFISIGKLFSLTVVRTRRGVAIDRDHRHDRTWEGDETRNKFWRKASIDQS